MQAGRDERVVRVFGTRRTSPPIACVVRANKECSGRRGICFQLFEVALLDLMHEGFAAEEIGFELRGNLAWDDEKLVANHLGKRDGAARGDEMRAPLKNKADVPQGEASEKQRRSPEGGAAGAENTR